MHKLFDPLKVKRYGLSDYCGVKVTQIYRYFWHDFSLYHSRFYAKKDSVKPSKLCIADKLAICLEPTWFYLPRVVLSGEIKEYMSHAKKGVNGKYETMLLSINNKIDWFNSVKIYLRKWVEEHKDGKDDTWTPDIKESINDHGVWK